LSKLWLEGRFYNEKVVLGSTTLVCSIFFVAYEIVCTETNWLIFCTHLQVVLESTTSSSKYVFYIISCARKKIVSRKFAILSLVTGSQWHSLIKWASLQFSWWAFSLWLSLCLPFHTTSRPWTTIKLGLLSYIH